MAASVRYGTWASAAVVMGVVFVSFLDNFAQLPTIAPYARSLGAAPAAVGLAVAAYSATNLVGNLLAGHLVDRVGRKPLLVLGLLVAAGAVLLYAAARSGAELVAVRALHGLAASVATPAAFALLGDLFPREQRGQAMGVSGALIAVAAMLAPPASGAIRDRWGFATVFAVVAALLVVAAVAALILVRETHAPAERAALSLRATLALPRRRPLLVAYATVLALTVGDGVLVTALPLFLADLGYRGAPTGLAFSAYALLALLVMASPVSRLGDLRGRALPMGWGLVCAGVSLLLLPLWPTLAAVLPLMALYGVGFGLIFPAATAQVADATLPAERGTAYGLYYALYSLGVILGALAAGLLAPGSAVSPLVAPFAAPFVLGGLVTLAAAPVVLAQASSARVPRPTP